MWTVCISKETSHHAGSSHALVLGAHLPAPCGSNHYLSIPHLWAWSGDETSLSCPSENESTEHLTLCVPNIFLNDGNEGDGAHGFVDLRRLRRRQAECRAGRKDGGNSKELSEVPGFATGSQSGLGAVVHASHLLH